ncbi:MAG: hypothetical protein FJW23_14230 [Acidimicrobiia bacterium]|nr:hypothetical protein [Acidimicrobiia bacterium]
MPPPLIASPDLLDVVRPGLVWLEGAAVVAHEPKLDAPLAAIEAAVRATPPDGTAAVRTMYRRLGLDPTKNRPSSEALLRRVVRGQPLPRINVLVDVCNWCSLEFQCPYGLYDAARLTGDRLELRLGRDGESYGGIRKDEVHVAGRMTLADGAGPFGNPTSDSARTMVTTDTTRVLVVVFAPAEMREGRLAEVLAETSRRMQAFTGAREIVRAPAS